MLLREDKESSICCGAVVGRVKEVVGKERREKRERERERERERARDDRLAGRRSKVRRFHCYFSYCLTRIRN